MSEETSREYEQDAQQASRGAKQGYQAAKKGKALAGKAAGSAKTAGKTASEVSPAKIKYILIGGLVLILLLLICALVGGTSQAQMDRTYHLTAKDEDNGVNRPSETDKEASLSDPEYTKEESNTLLGLISAARSADHADQLNKIKANCNANGWSYSLSINHLVEEPCQYYITSSDDATGTDLATGITYGDSLMLATYSVALSNTELTKTDGLFGRFFSHVGETYENEAGEKIDVVWFGEKAGKIDYEKELTKKLRAFKTTGGSFYDLDYERNKDGSIKVYAIGEILYVHPIIREKYINEISEELFQIAPDDPYVNGDDTGITNGEAANTIAANTSALLFGISAFSSSGIPMDLSGAFAWPVPSCSRITSPFGLRSSPTAGASTSHKGIDIGCRTGTPVVATENGTVITSAYSSLFGNYIIINHGNGITSYYKHLSRSTVTASQAVVKNMLIAYSGNTGSATTGPHLHFEIRINDVATNPLGFVSPP